MRPDTLGNLRVVAKDTHIVVERTAEDTTETDTAAVESVALETAKETTKAEEKKGEDGKAGRFAVLGAAFIIYGFLAFLLINYLTKKWK